MTRMLVPGMAGVGLICLLLGVAAGRPALGYPPAVGILGESRNCAACHESNGPWKDDAGLIIDLLDKGTGKSLKQADGTFLIAAKRNEPMTLLTVIGSRKASGAPPSHRNAWLYIDPQLIKDRAAMSKFGPGWEVNLPMSCRLVGDACEAYPDDPVTALPLTVRPGPEAKDAEIELQVMLTTGESVKGKAKEGLVSSYFERKVKIVVK